MDALSIIIGSAWILTASVIIALCIPLARGKIPPNRYYGMRFPESFASDDAWYAINRYGGRLMIIWAIPILILGIAVLFLPITPQIAPLLVPVVLAMVLIPTILTMRYASRYGKGGR
jgi:uncharacterized membrane protein